MSAIAEIENDEAFEVRLAKRHAQKLVEQQALSEFMQSLSPWQRRLFSAWQTARNALRDV